MSFLKSQKVLVLIALLVLVVLSSFKFMEEGEIVGLHHPESVYPYGNYIYVSNIGNSPVSPNKDGFITKLDKYGNILEFKFIDNLQAPKGIYPFDNKLYIADLNRLCIADLTSTKTKCIDIKGSKFLNDIVVLNGVSYITDTVNNCIYKVDKKGKVSLFFKKDNFSPNGIIFIKKQNVFAVVSFNSPTISLISLAGELKKSITFKGLTGFDGISLLGDKLFISDYRSGKIIQTDLTLKKYKIVKELNTPAADIFVSKDKIYLPLIEKNKLIIGRLQ
ncbi:ATP-binding protein [Hippea alviniae]|uniref:ATP-binding protein n=1 Tax=Hippea alviniae TaxID=1279027 RepID=UPI0003B6F3A0|nr:ATP-binding protein [Hippea alviniae]